MYGVTNEIMDKWRGKLRKKFIEKCWKNIKDIKKMHKNSVYHSEINRGDIKPNLNNIIKK